MQSVPGKANQQREGARRFRVRTGRGIAEGDPASRRARAPRRRRDCPRRCAGPRSGRGRRGRTVRHRPGQVLVRGRRRLLLRRGRCRHLCARVLLRLRLGGLRRGGRGTHRPGTRQGDGQRTSQHSGRSFHGVSSASSLARRTRLVTGRARPRRPAGRAPAGVRWGRDRRHHPPYRDRYFARFCKSSCSAAARSLASSAHSSASVGRYI